MNSKSDCSICLNELLESRFPFNLECNSNHTFCYLCIKNQVLYSNNNTCPLCRKELSRNDIFKIFNFKSLQRKFKIDKTFDKSNIIWGYSNKDKSAIWQYSIEDSIELEQAWQDYLTSDHKNSYILNTNCIDYLIDFISMTQINLKTDKIRNISRIDVKKPYDCKILGICGIPFNPIS